MATIPIEIILQDAESPVTPTPTPESGEETNITVPDTGTISDIGSNSGEIGSSASIILPAIIAVLAIGAIVAMLVHKYHKHQNDILSKKEKLATVASGTIAILAVTVLIGNLVIPATKAATDETGSSSDEGTYLETEDKVSIVATIDKDSKDPTIVTVKDTLYATTDASGYTVTMSMIEDALTSNLYLNGDETSQYYIAPVEVEDEDENENATKGVELATNTWGYRLSEDDGYLPVPVADTPATVVEGEAATTHEEINVYYGLKVDGTLPLGTYSGEIEYNIEGNYGFPKSLITMQGMTHEICESVPTPKAFKADGVTIEDNVPTATLKDTRDNKTYTIAKLADGNCWTTQNLNLQKEDLLDDVVLNDSNTDHPATNFTLPESQTSGDNSWGTYSETDIETTHVYNIIQNIENPYKYCLDYMFGNCIEWGNTIPEEMLGNLYNWYTATAGTGKYDTGSSDDGKQAEGSICPAGWRLPNSSNGHEATTDYSNLLYLYGIIQSPIVSGSITTDATAAYEAPLSLAPTGEYDNGFNNVGLYGNLWSSLEYDTTTARYFFFGESDVYILKTGYKIKGYAVRCVAR